MTGIVRAKVFITGKGDLLVFDKKLLKKTMRQAGQEVAAVAKSLIRSSTGKPGGPPKSVTGNLIRSIRVSPFRSGLGVTVSDPAENKRGQPYAVFLEAGVQFQTNPANRAKRVHRKRLTAIVAKAGMTTVLPRPFLSLALDLRRASIARRVQGAVSDGVAFKKVKP